MKSRPIRQSIILMGIFLILITIAFAFIKTMEEHNIKEGYLSTRLTISIQDILDSDLEDETKVMKLGNLDSGPLKMLPDLDSEEPPHMEPDGDEGPEPMHPDLDKDGDSEKEKKDKEEAFGNSVNDSEPNTMDMDAAIPDGNDLHKQKKGFRAAAGGDNPMNTESTDLRAQIRAELLQRLAEAKGAK